MACEEFGEISCKTKTKDLTALIPNSLLHQLRNLTL